MSDKLKTLVSKDGGSTDNFALLQDEKIKVYRTIYSIVNDDVQIGDVVYNPLSDVVMIVDEEDDIASCSDYFPIRSIY